MSDFRCPQCNKFVGKVRAHVKGLGEPEYIESVEGVCKKHGKVEPVGDWGWEDFYPEGNL